jgi:hypothetical protein
MVAACFAAPVMAYLTPFPHLLAANALPALQMVSL